MSIVIVVENDNSTIMSSNNNAHTSHISTSSSSSPIQPTSSTSPTSSSPIQPTSSSMSSPQQLRVPSRLLLLLRHVDNRLCSDCRCNLRADTKVFASLRSAVWLCKTCADIHIDAFDDDAIVKDIADDWSNDEIIVMETGVSNVHMNKVLSIPLLLLLILILILILPLILTITLLILLL